MPGKGLIVAGVLLACLLGLVGGYAMRPVLKDEVGTAKPHRIVPLPREPRGLGIQVLPGPLPEAGDEQPPPDLPDPAPADEAEARNAPPEPVEQVQPQPSPQPAPIPDQTPEPAAPPSARVIARPSFDCRYARSPAEQMVWSEPQLAAADRRLARAYRQALDAGVPRGILDRQQAVWIAAREQAARFGPAAVADVYGQRIAELQGMARY